VKAIKILLAIAVIIVVAVVVLGFIAPREWSVSVDKTIDQPAAVVFQQLNTPRAWQEWSAWSPANYPDMQYSYSGPDSGIGATSNWTDPSGSGQVVINASKPYSSIQYTVTFIGQGSMDCEYALSPAEVGTQIHWHCGGENGNNPIARLMSQFFIPMIEKDFEIGLGNLKTNLEGS